MALTENRKLHEIRVTFLPDGGVESRVQTDLVIVKSDDVEISRRLEAVAVDHDTAVAVLGQQMADATAQHDAVVAERDGYKVDLTAVTQERDALKIERDALKPVADTVPALTQERDALAADKATLIRERDTALAEAATVPGLKDQIITLKGTPVFKAEDLIKQLTTEEKSHITQVVSGNPELLALWSEFLGRVAGKEMPLDSPTVQAGIAGLRQILGEERVAALFATLNIDLANGVYMQ